MDIENTDARLAEIERLIVDFKEKFRAGTGDADHFITMCEIEKLWGEFQDSTNNIYIRYGSRTHEFG
ncbi:MAG: hypothetical protein LBS85_07385 [Clostridiales Family XIII bacterium]|jgi:hypothetical protein|nr:hypothetical protein [Clostridiales Family XIII bacterium]